MIDSDAFCKGLKKAGYDLITGVPDSLLKELVNSFEYFYKKKHIISTNEGSAVALAIGNYIGTKKPAVVYLQNSGLGNVINPITSLANPKVYGFPIMLIIGWRGEVYKNQQIKDEPQHKFQGLITLEQLKLLKIPFKVIDNKTKDFSKIIYDLKNKSIKDQTPVAIVVRKNTFLKSKYNQEINKKAKYGFFREEAISDIITNLKSRKNYIICTTGMASRELYEARVRNKQNLFKDFLTVGGMGHVSQIASGIALSKKKKIICIDGDGSFLMHTGAIGLSAKIKNLIHIVINNGAHDSVGGQPTLGNDLNLKKIAKEFGYKNTYMVSTRSAIPKTIKKCLTAKLSSMVVINCDKGHRKNLGRPGQNMVLRKKKFMKHIN
jgi:phosphonopyruvate decarboxylase